MSDGRMLAEIRYTDAAIVRVGSRPIHQFWHLLSPHFRQILLPPQRRSDGAGVSWSWRQTGEGRPPTGSELTELRKRLSDANRGFAEDPIGSEDEAMLSQVRRRAAEMTAQLLAKSDGELGLYVGRTESGLRLHSWGSATPAQPFDPATQQSEVSGVVLVAEKPLSGQEVRLENTKGESLQRERSDAEGKFRFSEVSPGTYRVRVVSAKVAFPVKGTQIRVERGSIEGLELRSTALVDAEEAAEEKAAETAGVENPAQTVAPIPTARKKRGNSRAARWSIGILVTALLIGAAIWSWNRWMTVEPEKRQQGRVYSGPNVARGPAPAAGAADAGTGVIGDGGQLGASVASVNVREMGTVEAPRAHEGQLNLTVGEVGAPGDLPSVSAPAGQPGSDGTQKASTPSFGESAGKSKPDDRSARADAQANARDQKAAQRSEAAAVARETTQKAKAKKQDEKPTPTPATQSANEAPKSLTEKKSETQKNAQASADEPPLNQQGAKNHEEETVTSGGDETRSTPKQRPEKASPTSRGEVAQPAQDAAAMSPAGDSPTGNNLNLKLNRTGRSSGGQNPTGPGSGAPAASGAPASAATATAARQGGTHATGAVASLSDDDSEPEDAASDVNGTETSEKRKLRTGAEPHSETASANSAPQTPGDGAATVKQGTGKSSAKSATGRSGNEREATTGNQTATTQSGADAAVGLQAGGDRVRTEPKRMSRPNSDGTSRAQDNAQSAEERSGNQRSTSPSATDAIGQDESGGENENKSSDSSEQSANDGRTRATGQDGDTSARRQLKVDSRFNASVRSSWWEPKVVRDLIVDTVPTRADQEESLEALQVEARQTSRAAMPEDFKNPLGQSGFVLTAQHEHEGQSLEWRDAAGRKISAGHIAGLRAEVGWIGAWPPRSAEWRLCWSDGTEVARIISDAAGRASLQADPEITSYYWTGVKGSKAADTDWRWRRGEGDQVPKTWIQETSWPTGEGDRLLIPLNGSAGVGEDVTIALVDEPSGWSLVSQVSCRVGPAK